MIVPAAALGMNVDGAGEKQGLVQSHGAGGAAGAAMEQAA